MGIYKQRIAARVLGFCILLMLPFLVMTQSFPVPQKEGELWGYKDATTGMWAIPPQYLQAETFAPNGLALACLPSKSASLKCGCIDTHGREVIPFQFINNFFVFNNLQPRFNSVNRIILAKPVTEINALYGMLNELGQVILPFEYETDYHAFNPLARYHILKKYDDPTKYFESNTMAGVVDSLGNVVLPFIYENLYWAGDLLIVTAHRKVGVINLQGQTILDTAFTHVYYSLHVQAFDVEQGGLHGLVNTDGTTLLPTAFRFFQFPDDQVIAAFKGKEYTLFRHDGSRFDSYSYTVANTNSNIQALGDGIRVVGRDGKVGAVNANWQEVIPFIYDGIVRRTNDHYAATLDGKTFIIDVKGNRVNELKFDAIHNNIAIFDGKSALINADGEPITPFRFDGLQQLTYDAGPYTEGGFCDFTSYKFVENGKVGILDSVGNVLLAPQFDEVVRLYCFQGKMSIMAKMNGKLGIADIAGNTKITFEYELIDDDYSKYVRFKMGNYLLQKGERQYLIDWGAYKTVPTSDPYER